MRQASIRELKHETKKVMALVEAGEIVEVTRHNQLIAVISPVLKPALKMPDFLGRIRGIHGNKMMEITASEMIAEERGDR